MEKNTNKLIQKNNPKVIFDFLKNIKINDERLLVWKMSGGSKLTVKVSLKIIKKFNNQLVLEVDSSLFEKLNVISSGSEFINFFVMNKGLLFRCRFVSLNRSESQLIVKFPEMVAQAERRKSLRHVLPDTSDACRVGFYKRTVEGQNQMFKKSCYDISSGGFSFLITKAESKFFAINDDLLQINLEVEDMNFSVDGRIVNFIPVEPGPENSIIYAGFRVCVQFTELDPVTRDLIEIYVFKHIDFEQAS